MPMVRERESCASRRQSERDQAIVQAFRDLEGDVCNLKSMSVILETFAEEAIRGDSWGICGTKPIEGYRLCLLTEDEFQAVHFAVLKLGSMIRDLHKSYFKAFDAARDEATQEASDAAA